MFDIGEPHSIKFLFGLLFFFGVALGTYIVSRNIYIQEKSKGWMYIIIFTLVCLLIPAGEVIFSLTLGMLGCFDFIKNEKTRGFFVGRYLIYMILFGLFCAYIQNYFLEFLVVFIFISFSDIIAYFFGKIFPYKRGIFPMSPNKTLSGFLAQWFFLSVSFHFLFSYESYITIFLAFLVPIGDLLESSWKRFLGIKDSGTYIPGHGGVLDRIDSSILLIPILSLIILFS